MYLTMLYSREPFSDVKLFGAHIDYDGIQESVLQKTIRITKQYRFTDEHVLEFDRRVGGLEKKIEELEKENGKVENLQKKLDELDAIVSKAKEEEEEKLPS